MLIQPIKNQWSAPNGYRRVLSISLPLIASMASTTLMLFTDRVFLGHYSVVSLAAATPGGLTAFMFIAFFLGIVSYANTFVAQYVGSGQDRQVGAAIWQALYFSILAGILMALLYFLAPPLFALGGHDLPIQRQEVIYFRILVLGAGLGLMRDALSCFYSGRGLTKTIMVVNVTGAIINIPLDYALINGYWGFPELGIAGAGIATVTGHFIMLLLFTLLIFRPRHDQAYAVLRNWKFNPSIFGRLVRFGLPAGIQFFLDIFAFSFFIFMVGRLGKDALAATNIAFAINMLAFLPMIGVAIATSTLVGQSIGAGRPDDGAESTRSALHLTMCYMSLVALLFVCVPGWMIDLFKPTESTMAEFAPIRGTGIVLLRFVAIYTVFDALNLIYSAAIKGAGDTRFVGWTVAILSMLCLVLPVYISLRFFDASLYLCWTFATAYVCIISLVFKWRFHQGKWKHMRVIEVRQPAVLQQSGVPATDDIL